jgi:beta-galactosidase
VNTCNNGNVLTSIYIKQENWVSRTCTYAADVANVFNGVNEVIPVRGFNYRQFGVADYHRDHQLNQLLVQMEALLLREVFMKR